MAKSFKNLVRKTGNKKTKKIAKKRTELLEKFKLQYDEQYGYWSYYVDGENVYDLKEVEIKGKKYKVVDVHNSEMSYEMGRQSVVNSTKYYIKIPFEGTTVLVDLIQLLDRKTPDWLDHKKTKIKSKVSVFANG
jgi:hypothetical protein